MPSSPARTSTVTRGAAAALLTIALLLPAAVAQAKTPTVKCQSGDLRYPFRPGGPKDFGVFNLRITGGNCGTAHRVAKDWMKRFEANLRAGHVKLPRSIDGFSFTTLPAKAAQTYREQGRKQKTTIRFDYRVPNG